MQVVIFAYWKQTKPTQTHTHTQNNKTQPTKHKTKTCVIWTALFLAELYDIFCSSMLFGNQPGPEYVWYSEYCIYLTGTNSRLLCECIALGEHRNFVLVWTFTLCFVRSICSVVWEVVASHWDMRRMLERAGYGRVPMHMYLY